MCVFKLFLYGLGLLYTLCILTFIAVATPILLVIRLGIYIRDKLFLPRSCDLLWPRPHFGRAFLWLSRQTTLQSIDAIVNGHPPATPKCIFVPSPLTPVEVVDWDHATNPLNTNDDLTTYIQGRYTRVPYQVKVQRAVGFEGDAYGHTLLHIKTHPDSYALCMARIVTALSQGNVFIEVEPRVYYECILKPDAKFEKIRRGADAILKFIDSFIIGPWNLTLLIQRKPEKVWRALMATSHDQVATYTRRMSFNAGPDDSSETSRLTVASVVQLNTLTDVAFNITEICDVDELQKAERLMRATMAELLTSFLAGALRTYFRESDPGVQHPPDCMAAFAVCSHKLSQCNTADPCDHLLMPIKLPIGVEGMIPRLWSLQEQFADHGKMCVPQTIKVFNSLVRFLLPRKAAERMANVFFKHTVLNVSFIRIHGDVMLDGNVLTRFVPIPPLSLPSRASFVFVEHKNKIHLVSSIDRGLFERHTDLFKHMKTEQEGLLKHLSFRLRTLSQTCVLPDQLPSEINPAPPEAPQNSPSAERDELLPGPSNPRPRRQSMADLNGLLREIQDELDEMRKNPNVDDREGTIKRLTELENKIKAFHDGMKSELWGNMSWHRQEQDDAMKKVAALLAPYKRRVSVSGRKTSVRASKEYSTLRRSSATMSNEDAERREEEAKRRRSEERNSEETAVMMVDEERREERGEDEGENRVEEVKEEDVKVEEKKDEEEVKDGEKW